VNRIDARFNELRSRGETAFIAYIAAGDPTLDRTGQFILDFEQAGVDVLELGVPFSDPLADGVVNQEAAQRALQAGVSLEGILAMVKGVRQRGCELPLLLFTYFNPVLAYGLEAFAAAAADAGVDGVLCVDLPVEEADEYRQCLHDKGIATVFLAAPTSTPERIKRIAEASTGFIYYVSRTGVTGVQERVEDTVRGAVGAIRQHTDKPVAVGFGISRPEQAAEVAAYADGVVVGSAIVRLIGEHGNHANAIEQVGAFVRSLVDATKSVRRAAS